MEGASRFVCWRIGRGPIPDFYAQVDFETVHEIPSILHTSKVVYLYTLLLPSLVNVISSWIMTLLYSIWLWIPVLSSRLHCIYQDCENHHWFVFIPVPSMSMSTDCVVLRSCVLSRSSEEPSSMFISWWSLSHSWLDWYSFACRRRTCRSRYRGFVLTLMKGVSPWLILSWVRLDLLRSRFYWSISDSTGCFVTRACR